MRTYVDCPREVGDSIVGYHVALVAPASHENASVWRKSEEERAPALHGVATYCTAAEYTVTRAHRDWVCGVEDMRYVLCGERDGQM